MVGEDPPHACGKNKIGKIIVAGIDRDIHITCLVYLKTLSEEKWVFFIIYVCNELKKNNQKPYYGRCNTSDHPGHNLI